MALWIGLLLAWFPTARADDAGFRKIFDGRSLDGWDGNSDFWSVQDGAITGETTPEKRTRGNTFIIWRDGELDDFELKVEYRIFGHNSGIQFRSFEVPDQKWVVGGYQADVEAGDRWSGTLYGERYRGVLARRGDKTVIGANHKSRTVGSVGDTAELQGKIRKEDWNEYHIIARGHRIVQKINGHLMAECVDEDTEMRRRSGILALQLHQGPPMKVQFRNIRLKRLKMEDRKKVVFIAGRPSHGYGSHEHNAGCLLLAKALNENAPGVHATVYQNRHPRDTTGFHPDGWPKDPTALDNADSVVYFLDGGGRHPVNHHLEEMGRLAAKGVGMACLHYAVETRKGEEGNRFLDWVGGYFEPYWSVNPHWVIKNPTLAKNHPITRGVKPFEINDEWYFNMRFRENMKGVTPILSAVPPESTMSRPDGAHSGNPHVRELVKKKTPMHLAWAAERPDGGRGFGFTGGHFHWNWANDDFRKLVLNAIAWSAGAEVPAAGIESKTPTREELEANQDYPKSQERRRRRQAR